jgi:peptidoglycan/LPS O-acetylase OafA/YrhL
MFWFAPFTCSFTYFPSSALCSSAYAISFFLPIILMENMGYGRGEAQYLSAPPYVLACIVMALMAWLGDRYRIRGPLLLVNCALGFIGAPMLGWAPQSGVRYFGTFLICASAQGGIPTCMTYQANNIRGHWKRAFCSATMIGFGGIGGIAGSLIFRTQDKPTYHPGIYGVLACNVLIAIIVVINTIYFRRENKKADRGEKVLEGDVNFRYTI